MTPATKTALATGGGLLVGTAVGYFVVRAQIVKRCKKKVRAGCKTIPLTSDAFCDEQARGICVGAPSTSTITQQAVKTVRVGQSVRGERRRKGRPVSRANTVKGSIKVGRCGCDDGVGR